MQAIPYVLAAVAAKSGYDANQEAKASRREAGQRADVIAAQRTDQEAQQAAREKAQIVQLNARRRSQFGRSGGVLLNPTGGMPGQGAQDKLGTG